MTCPTLGVVIPIKLIDANMLGKLVSMANGAQMLNFVAVGRTTTTKIQLPANLTVIDKDCSIYAAMNEGTSRASADYLIYMGIDDSLVVKNISQILAKLKSIERAALVILPFVVHGRLVRQSFKGKVASFHHQGALFSKDAVLAAGGYSEFYKLHSDLDLMFRLQSAGGAENIDHPLVIFSKGGATTSGRNAGTSIKEFSAIYKANDVSRLCWNFAFSMALTLLYGVRFLLSGTRRE